MYATIDGLENYKGGSVSDNGITDADLAEVEARILAYIFPRHPTCEIEFDAVEKATYVQVLHECDENAREMAMLRAAGVRGVTLSKFSAQLDPMDDSLFPSGVAAATKATLLIGGLLFRGVDAR